MWTETYLSAILRAIRYADDASYRLAGYRKLDPITTIEGESRFLKAAEELFFQGMSTLFFIPVSDQVGNDLRGENGKWKGGEETLMTGWQLGSDPEIQVATNVTNHLTAATLKYFADSFRLGRAANLFEKMAEKEPEVAALLARAYIGMSRSSFS